MATKNPQDPKPSAAPAATKGGPPSALAMMKRDVIDVVGQRIAGMLSHGELHLPQNYSAENAIKAAWLNLQTVEDKAGNRALDVCTKDSIANALLDMVVQGLTPLRQQVYFIVYGKRLVCQRSYFGAVALLRRAYGPQVDVRAEVVYHGDEFEYEVHPRKRVLKHTQKLANVDKAKIVAAYATIELGNGREPHTEIMTMEEVRRAWEQGATKGESPAHKGFTPGMAKKTVINRAAKLLINACDDSALVRAVQRQSVASAVVATDAEAAEVTATAEVIDLPPAELPAGEMKQPAIAGLPAEREPGEDPVGEDPGLFDTRGPGW